MVYFPLNEIITQQSAFKRKCVCPHEIYVITTTKKEKKKRRKMEDIPWRSLATFLGITFSKRRKLKHSDLNSLLLFLILCSSCYALIKRPQQGPANLMMPKLIREDN